MLLVYLFVRLASRFNLLRNTECRPSFQFSGPPFPARYWRGARLERDAALRESALSGQRGGNAIIRIQGWTPLCQRSPEAADRRTPGHWEAYLMLFGNHGQAPLLLAWRPQSKAAEPIAAAMVKMLPPLPP